MTSSFHERLRFAFAPGGLKATAFWFTRVLLCLDVHLFLALALPARGSAPKPSPAPYSFLHLHSERDATAVPDLVEQLEEQTGTRVHRLLTTGSSIYALVDRDEVAAQLNISSQPTVLVDTPTDLHIGLAPADGFLGYLYTYPRYRGRGAAGTLLSLVYEDTARRGLRRLVTHVRATNVPPLRVFTKNGWLRLGYMITTRSGRLFVAPSVRRHGLQVSKVP